MAKREPAADCERTAPGHGIAAPGHATVDTGAAPSPKRPRILQEQPSIDAATIIERGNALSETVLRAAAVPSDALRELAGEHLSKFKTAYGEECIGAMAPNREILVATASEDHALQSLASWPSCALSVRSTRH